ncbi:hypothetical protein [Bacillus sp. T3]|uniref:hypothetical protein n=1 Tax=Bacillus sp. T3 TaxID=467262 RepID=UPI002981C973|nr:hypothetical protein [Bacillus sp. T3]
MSCMKLERESIQNENTNLLLEILYLKIQLRDLYEKTGPGNSEYISLSIKLDILQNEYIDSKLVDIIGHTEKKETKKI